MDIALLPGIEQVIDLGIGASEISIINNGKYPIYAKNNIAVVLGDSSEHVISAECTTTIHFGTNNCRYLHLISPGVADVDFTIKSIFKPIHRGNLVAGVEAILDFMEPANKYTIMNFSASDTLYFAVGSIATIDGAGTIELPPGVIMSDSNVSAQKIHLISGGTARYQVTGQVR